MVLVVSAVICICIYYAQQKIFKKNWDRRLDVDVSFSVPHMEIGEKAYISERINNAKVLPLTVLHVKFAVSRYLEFCDRVNTDVTDMNYRNDGFSVMSNEKITINIDFVARKRGFYSISSVSIIARDYFMVKQYARYLKLDAGVYVFPLAYPYDRIEDSMNDILGEIEVRRRLMPDPFAYAGIREYVHGDSMRSINWKASAMNDRLMVNKHNSVCSGVVRILLNLEPHSMIRPEKLQEVSISLVRTVAESLVGRKQDIEFYSNGRDILETKENCMFKGNGSEALKSVNKCLARINGNSGIQDFYEVLDREVRNVDPDIYYVVISPYYKADLLQKLDHMWANGVGISMLVPYYDINGFESVRGYMKGVEIGYNET
ncbi:uncharacterized protein BN781_01688 [Coprococcus sp. CAG:782]|nr:uncharacterized protein BN781_01688 [Coprococcus sp. CAG:782]